MNARFVILAVVVLIAACGRPGERAPETVYWACDGIEFAGTFRDGGLRVQLPGSERLLQVANGGSRYVSDGILVRFVDDGAVLDLDGARYGCDRKVWDGPFAAARERGAVFRALGQEPGWHAEVIPAGPMTLVLDYGERTITVPAPEPVELEGGARGYETQDQANRLILLLIEPIVCFDTMSGQVFPATVTVAIGDERYRGCGVAL